MTVKERYFTVDGIDGQVSAIMAKVDRFPSRARLWNAKIDTTALLVTDMQNYFLDPASHAFIPSAPSIIQKINVLIDYFRLKNLPVIFTRHVNNHENAGSMGWWWNDMITEHTFQSLLAEGIDPGNDPVMVKSQYDAFFGTELENTLKANKIQHIVICGVMTNLCCETTVRSAFVKGFKPVLPIDATATYNLHLHIATFRNLAFGFAPLMTSAEMIENIIPDA